MGTRNEALAAVASSAETSTTTRPLLNPGAEATTTVDRAWRDRRRRVGNLALDGAAAGVDVDAEDQRARGRAAGVVLVPLTIARARPLYALRHGAWRGCLQLGSPFPTPSTRPGVRERGIRA